MSERVSENESARLRARASMRDLCDASAKESFIDVPFLLSNCRHPEWQESYLTKIQVYVGCACLGDTIGALWLTPSEIVKQRVQVCSHCMRTCADVCVCVRARACMRA